MHQLGPVYKFHSTRREGRDSRDFERTFPFNVSTTRPRGARPRIGGSDDHGNSFNPRAREGRDDFSLKPGGLCGVSIHAPARGATMSLSSFSVSVCFNPRAREGRDRSSTSPVRPLPRFNPRAREGRDQGMRGTCHKKALFQSTRPRGARHHPIVTLNGKILVSIHAPARGAT